jgi:hypothetical protein
MDSISGQVEKVKEAFDILMNPQMPEPKMPEVEEVFPDYVIACVDGIYYKIKYKLVDNSPVFEPREKWLQVEETYKPVKSEYNEEVVYFGSQVKAIKMDDGRYKFGGYLVRFGDENTTDLTGDFFTKNTDYGTA